MKRSRSTLLCVPVAAVGLVIGAAGSADALPSGVTHVSVTTGVTHSGIDAHLKPAGSIAGTIKSVAGAKAVSVTVTAYSGGRAVESGFTDSSGHYLIGGLPASSTGYAVCADGAFASGGGSTTGYLGRCYKTAAFNGHTVPAGASKVTLTSGQQRTGISFNLPSGAAISGTTRSASGTAVPFVSVSARNRSTGAVFFAFGTQAGTYSIKGMTASAKGYAVCANPFDATSGTGLLPRCYKNVAWSGSTASFPSTATAVGVTVGKTHTGVNLTLPRAGAIAGTITDATSGTPLSSAAVLVFTSTGRILNSAATNSKGQYAVKGLPAASGDRVCVFGGYNAAQTLQYGNRCWKNVSWNGGKLPAGTTGVSVKTAQTHTGISFKLSRVRLGSIAGTVTAKAGGQPIQGAEVQVFLGSATVAGASTDASGHYKVVGLRAATSYVVCATQPLFSTSPTPPASGWAPRCHTDVAWNGISAPPSAAAKVALTAGQAKTGINVALHLGGAIAGAVTRTGTTTPVDNVEVELFTGSGRFITSTSSSFNGSSDGTYSFTGLSPVSAAAGYIVCFDGRSMFGQAGYLPQCYNNVAWNGS